MDIEKIISALPINEQEKLLSQVAEYKAALERSSAKSRSCLL